MKKIILLIFFTLVNLGLIVWAPVYAQGDKAKEAVDFVTGQAEDITTLPDETRDLRSMIQLAIDIAVVFSGIIAVALLIVGGYKYITAAGNEENSRKARETITYAVIGLVVVLAAYLIINTVLKALMGDYTGS